jgi:CheY-like chemotaxis protein
VSGELDPAAAAREALQGKRVLVVEDNGLLCCVLEETLRGVGCEVIGPYAWLSEAMAQASVHEIDLALLDMNLHGELVKPLADQLQERGIPFLLTSAYRASELPHTLQSAAQLRKPFTDTDLLIELVALARTHQLGNN